jgi:hypothetical protein
MTIFYSSSAGGFLDSEIHTSIPDDAVSLSAESHLALLEAALVGSIIVPGEGGMPMAVPAPPPAEEEMFRRMRDRRNQLLRACDWTQVADTKLSPETRDAWATYRQSLRDLPEEFADDPASAVWPEPPQN